MMKILLSLIVAIFLSACTTTSKHKNVNFGKNYDRAVVSIKQGDFENAYRNLETYYLLDDVLKKPTRILVETRINIERLFAKHPELISAGLNTFSNKSFYNTLKSKKGDKEKAKRLELLRIRAFKKISPKNYPVAANNFTQFFDQSPEALTKKIMDANQARRKAKGNFASYTAKGNLEVTKPIKCIELNTLNNKHTPADIFTGVSECIKKDDVKRATRLYALALAYGRYDQLRMIDKTARQAIRVLQYQHIKTSNEFRLKFKEEIKNHSAANKNSEEFISLCRDIKKIGKPDYHPRYMIRHGISAFTGKTSGIAKDFNEEETWNKIYSGYLKCS